MKRIAQTYDTVITSTEEDLTLRVISIPSRYVDGFSDISTIEEVSKLLGSGLHCTLKPNSLVGGIVATLKPRAARDAGFNLRILADLEPEATSFVKSALEDAWIPIENSPLSGERLAALASNSPIALGAGLGIYSAHDNPILVLLLVPAGIIICGAAVGISEALRSGLKQRVEDIICPTRKHNRRFKRDE